MKIRFFYVLYVCKYMYYTYPYPDAENGYGNPTHMPRKLASHTH
jgi:hypothetical protein